MRARDNPGVCGARAALLALALGFSCGAVGEDIDDTVSSALKPDRQQAVDEIVVVAHKHARARSDVAATVSVFDSRDMQFELASSIADVFRYAPGIDYEAAGTRFGSESINIRGISGNRVAILVDGVPVSDQFDVGSFSNATRDLVSAGFVDQIEVLHGPASALYGSSAIGGVVSMRTVEPVMSTGNVGQGGQMASSWRGDDSSVQATVIQGFKGQRVSLVAGLATRDGEELDAAAVDENIDTRDFSSRAGLIKLALEDPLGNTLQANLYLRDANVRSELESMLGSGRFRSNTALRGEDDYRTHIASLEYRFDSESPIVDEGLLRGYVQGSTMEQRTYDERGLARRPVAIDRFFSFEQETRGFEGNFQKQFPAGQFIHRLGYGFEYRERETEEYRDGIETGLEDGQVSNVLLGEVFPLRDFPISTTSEWGAYIEDSMTNGRWSLIAGLRWDAYDMQPELDAMYVEDYPFAAPVSISESELSPKVGLIYHLAASTEVFLQYSQGFRAPPYEDANTSLELPLFNIRAVPNPGLRSERSEGFDIGLRWRGTSNSAHLSVFRTDYEDFIESRVRIGTDPESGRILFQSQNLGKAVIEGVEAGGSFRLSSIWDGLSLDAALFIARSENRDNGQPLNSVGPPQAVTSVNWLSANERWNVSLRGTFTDRWSERDETSGELFKPPGYASFDLYAAWQPNTRITLRGGVLNLTDRTYWSWTDVRGLAPDDPVIPYLSRPGLSFSMGLDITW
jgi:hemoglobin/transferrin/lactoferrin receptor protein